MKKHVYKEKYSSFFEPEIDVLEKKRNKRVKYQSLSKAEFISRAKDVHGDRFDYSKVKYINRSTEVLIFCKEHGIEFSQTPTNHLSGWMGCPHCSYSENRVSRGEKKIKEILEMNNVEYVFQKRFSDCKHIKTLRFDFWLPEFNVLIEYDGLQHYEPIEYFGGEIVFESQQIKDEIKNNYASENGIKLLRIPYHDIDRVSDILENNLILNNI